MPTTRLSILPPQNHPLEIDTTTTREPKSPLPFSSSTAVLLTVPLAWGTYTPVVQYLTHRQHVPGLVFCAAYYSVAAVTLWGICYGITKESSSPRRPVEVLRQYGPGGLELGGYLWVANFCQLIGLQSVPADRAGFLVQLTTIGVPLLQAMTDRRRIPLRTWGACGLALVGVLVFDAPEVGSRIPTALGAGDGWIIAAALGYSWHVVRLGRYARTVEDALPLAACKATVEAGLSLGLVGLLSMAAPIPTTTDTVNDVTAYVMDTGRDIVAYATAMSTTLSEEGVVDTVTMSMPVLGAILWTGWVTCAYTIFAQSYGQSRVPPTEANLIYSIQPLCTALFAYILLGDTLSPSGVVGASFIAAAVYIVAVADDTNSGE